MRFAPIRTARSLLRPLRARDRGLFCALYGDAATMRHIAPALSKPAALRSFRATLAAMRAGNGPWFFTIVNAANRRPIGVCAIQPITGRASQLGIMLEPAQQRRGIGTEALRALTCAAFEALPIDALWVQYRSANAAAGRLVDGLGFLPATTGLPRAARRSHCVGIMQRVAWSAAGCTIEQGTRMSSMIRFLENAGRDAALRHATAERVQLAMRNEQLAPELQAAVLNHDRARIDDLVGGVHKIHCLNFPVRVPKKAPAKTPPKKPVKAPPKKPGKAPAKKPAKSPAKKAVSIH